MKSPATEVSAPEASILFSAVLSLAYDLQQVLKTTADLNFRLGLERKTEARVGGKTVTLGLRIKLIANYSILLAHFAPGAQEGQLSTAGKSAGSES